MYNHEAPAHRKLILRSLLICWLIILGGYLLIRMVFLVFGLQLHLTAQGICLALLPYCFGALPAGLRVETRFRPLRLVADRGGRGGHRRTGGDGRAVSPRHCRQTKTPRDAGPEGFFVVGVDQAAAGLSAYWPPTR